MWLSKTMRKKTPKKAPKNAFQTLNTVTQSHMTSLAAFLPSPKPHLLVLVLASDVERLPKHHPRHTQHGAQHQETLETLLLERRGIHLFIWFVDITELN